MHEGKMFGVLVVEHEGHLGYLQGFSGMWDGAWHVDGFVPPLFDSARRDAMWPAGEAELDAITAQIAALDRSPRERLAALDREHAVALDALRTRHRDNRARRKDERDRIVDAQVRAVLAGNGLVGDTGALDEASRADTRERRNLLATHAAEREPLSREVAALDATIASLEDTRAAKSRGYLHALFDMYSIANARGEVRPLRALFEGEPPGGAGDCALPKLLGHAYRIGARPIAAAEVWCGPPPLSGGRIDGVFYPACRGKCGPLLAHMLEGLDAEEPPAIAQAIDPALPEIVFEDDWLVVVDKPPGLLSVPGKTLRDSAATRLEARLGPIYVVHRLDLDASGLLMFAKTKSTHEVLQRMFAERRIDKRYIAWLDGNVAGDSGVVELALRVDVDDRPRQIHDPVHGKPALTEWHVLAREVAQTRVALFPRTGRSHQLRVHASHPSGIGAPIVGDRLYGRADRRLLLHAEELSFIHPGTQRRLILRRDCPF